MDDGPPHEPIPLAALPDYFSFLGNHELAELRDGPESFLVEMIEEVPFEGRYQTSNPRVNSKLFFRIASQEAADGLAEVSFQDGGTEVFETDDLLTADHMLPCYLETVDGTERHPTLSEKDIPLVGERVSVRMGLHENDDGDRLQIINFERKVVDFRIAEIYEQGSESSRKQSGTSSTERNRVECPVLSVSGFAQDLFALPHRVIRELQNGKKVKLHGVPYIGGREIESQLTEAVHLFNLVAEEALDTLYHISRMKQGRRTMAFGDLMGENLCIPFYNELISDPLPDRQIPKKGEKCDLTVSITEGDDGEGAHFTVLEFKISDDDNKSKTKEIEGNDKISLQEIEKDFYLLDKKEIKHILGGNKLTIEDVKFVGTANWLNSFVRRVLIFGVIALESSSELEEVSDKEGGYNVLPWNKMMLSLYNEKFDIGLIPKYLETNTNEERKNLSTEDIPRCGKRCTIVLESKNKYRKDTLGVDEDREKDEIIVSEFKKQ